MVAANELIVSDITSLKNELHLGQTPQSMEAFDANLDSKATSLVSSLSSFEPTDETKKSGIKAAVETMGYELQKEAGKQHDMLKRPLAVVNGPSEDGGEVANALVNLKLQVEDLDPARFDFSAGFLSRILGYLPFVGTPIKRYFSRFESAQTVIDAIIKSIENGRATLERDNITLKEDQRRMRELTHKIKRAAMLGQWMDQKLVYSLEREMPLSDPHHSFLQEEILFAMRQRIQDLQQQLAVNQQGVLATEIIIRNNKELIRGVNRALNVTVGALQVAVTVAMALENQRIVLDKVGALTATTDTLIANTSARLKTQGAAIHKQAASTALDMETLKNAFKDINAAMEDIASFRRAALPQLAQNILEMDQLNQAAEASIKKMENSSRSENIVHVDIE